MLNRSRTIARSGKQDPEMVGAIDTALCGVFNTTTYASLAFQKAALMKKPETEYLPQNHDPRDTWAPYPRQSESVPAHTNCWINANFDLHVILWDITNCFFADEKPPRSDWVEMVNSFHARLQRWSEQLPDCIGLGQTSVPGIIDLQYVRMPFIFVTALTVANSTRYYVAILVISGSSRTSPTLMNFHPNPGTERRNFVYLQLVISASWQICSETNGQSTIPR